MPIKRFLPFLTAFIALALMELFLFRSRFIYVSSAVMLASIVVSIFILAKNSLIDKRWWNYSILPILFSSSLVVYSVLLPYKNNIILMQSLFFLNAIFLYYYIRSVYYNLVLPTAERSTNLENISSFGNFLSFFFISASAYGLQSFLGLPTWQLILVIMSASLLLTYQMIWASRANIQRNHAYILISCLILTEIAWAMFYLPFNFNVTGAILAIDYYIIAGILRTYLHGGLNGKMLKLYLGFGLASIVIILITARWL